MSSSNWCFLMCIQISQEAGKVVWYSDLLKIFLQFVVVHTVKDFGIDSKADVFLELLCFFDDPAGVGNLISGSSAFSKYSLNIWKFMVQVLLKPGLENFEHYFASVWDACSCMVVWAFFDIAFLSCRSNYLKTTWNLVPLSSREAFVIHLNWSKNAQPVHLTNRTYYHDHSCVDVSYLSGHWAKVVSGRFSLPPFCISAV